MAKVTLGSTGITVEQNAFGALPIQRTPMEDAVRILRKAYDGGMRFFDTSRAYTDSEAKIGAALADVRGDIFIATKTRALTPEQFWADLEKSLETLRTDYIDIYQFHLAKQCFRPDDGTGLYECMVEAKKQGKIRHIGITCHKMSVAHEAIESGLYETVQYPFSYLSSDKDIEIVNKAKEHNMGFIAMKSLSGGLITNSAAAYAWASQFDNLVPIWGIQHEHELDEFLSYFAAPPTMTDEIKALIDADRAELDGEFCRGCGYCCPCPAGIVIYDCARMSLMIRRSPSAALMSEAAQEKMAKIEGCLNCGKCKSKCPYGLDIPNLLKKNLEDYKKIIAGEIKI
ncbi:MAG: aldo/keto reductase [Firmicutes bacterium]|nr:aldo/keto reductase [Bacillota bacterium]MBR6824470.1 aldo/keto reductase [Bacillota bacterium]